LNPYLATAGRSNTTIGSAAIGWARSGALAAMLLVAWPASGETSDQDPDDEPAYELEVGPSTEREAGGGATRSGLALSFEVTPVEHWLEIEFGVSALGPVRDREYAVGLAFKKPFTLSPTTELVVGLGPYAARANAGSIYSNSHGMEAVVDVRFSTRHDFRWFVEPSWSRAAATGDRALGITVGLVFGN